MCEQMKWNHLPVAGGLYDQHPRLLEEWNVIFRERAKKEEQDRRAEEAKNKRQGGGKLKPRRH